MLRPGHAASASAPASALHRGVAFHGDHQAGVTTARQAQSAFVSFDLTAATRTELEDVLRSLTARARFLTAGGTPPNLGISAPPSDSGLLGPVVPTSGLTITVGLGASAFDDRFGLQAARPRRLRRRTPSPTTISIPRAAMATCSCRSARTIRTSSFMPCVISPGTPAAACSHAGG